MEIIKYPDKTLLTPTKVVEIFDGSPWLLGKKMLGVMKAQNGAGLAANQVGYDLRLFVTSELEDDIIVNPSWEPTISGFDYPRVEGCLSFPGWLVPVKRFDAINAQWQDIAGNKKQLILRGFAAQVFQHETDHLDSVLMIDHLTKQQQRTLRRFYKEN